MDAIRLGVRWTVGAVSESGFEALRLSIWGAWRVFGKTARYAVGVNSLPLAEARTRVGRLPIEVAWIDTTHALPERLRAYFDEHLAEGVGWKFAPVRLFTEGYELALDNDCILWDLPASMRRCFAQGGQNSLVAEDVRCAFGRFAPYCPPEPRNSGVRGLPDRLDYEATLLSLLQTQQAPLDSELDEQGLQIAALARCSSPLVVTLDEVSICSPFPPHLPWLGRCGAHFVGLNARQLPWSFKGQPAVAHIQQHWRKLRSTVARLVGVA